MLEVSSSGRTDFLIPYRITSRDLDENTLKSTESAMLSMRKNTGKTVHGLVSRILVENNNIYMKQNPAWTRDRNITLHFEGNAFKIQK